MEKKEHMAVIASSYFNDLFVSSNPSELEAALHEIQLRVTEEMNRALIAEGTEDVKIALFLTHPEKSSGPDGMTTLFFQNSWQIIKTDFLNMVNKFLREGVFDKRLNMTNICLFPKTNKPRKMA